MHRSIHRVIHQGACNSGEKLLFLTGYTGDIYLDHRCIHIAIDQRPYSLKVDVMLVFLLVIHLTPKHIEYSIMPPA